MNDENTNPADGTTTEQVTPGSDDWGDISLGDVAAEDSGTEEESENEDGTGEKAEADQQTPGTGEKEGEAPADEKPGEQKQQEAEQLFELKHLGKVRQVKRDEAIALAQKGLDYDHIRQERDAAKDKTSQYEEFLKELAAPQNISIEDLMDNTRAQLLVNREKTAGRTVDQETALARVKLDRERKAFEAAKAQETQTKTEEDQAAEIRRQGFIQFTKEYPTVDVKTIPKEVWDRVNAGESLFHAYAQYENKTLRAENEKLKKYQENKDRSTGSRKSAGNASADTDFDKAWYNGE